MKDLIDIRLKYVDPITEELTSSVEKIFINLIEKAKELEIWDDSITTIVVTDNLGKRYTCKQKNGKQKQKSQKQRNIQ